jgi:hypothetical protein
MVVRRRVLRLHIVAAVDFVLCMTSTRNRADRRLLPWAQHGSCDRTPDGKQDGQQNQDEGAEKPHT